LSLRPRSQAGARTKERTAGRRETRTRNDVSMTAEMLPEGVAGAYERAAKSGFELSCDVEVGRLLAVLAAATPSGGRILEIGTGVGVGLAWLVHGLGARMDAHVVTVELDAEVQRTARSVVWPSWVSFESGDGAEAVSRLGDFDLIFADAPGGKIFKLRRTVAALRPGGVLVVDDMELARHQDEQLRIGLAVVRQRLFDNVELVCAELEFASGVIVATKRRPRNGRRGSVNTAQSQRG
jgi:predicted O-methyltransferase YrrM